MRRFSLAVAALTLLAAAFVQGSARANGPGAVVYADTGPTDHVGYARTIILQHSGSANGTLLATFEHWSSSKTPTPFVIMCSTTGGQTWSRLSAVFDGEKGPGHPWPILFQPFLFELPRTLGRYPAGTLLLAGNVCPASADATHFQLWRSRDHGAHWDYVSTFQTGGGGSPGRGIWEPFLALNQRGALVCYFSDERQWAKHSQFLGHIVSEDGGDTWGPEVADVASADPADRPGMATVAHPPGGPYVMSYEVCGPHGCEVRIKTSPDGDAWGTGPADLGTRPETPDGRFLSNSPYITTTPDGALLLTGQFEKLGRADVLGPESGQIIFLNTRTGSGPWSWTPAPFRPPPGPAANTNYSPCLMVSPDGTEVRLTTASGGGAWGQVRTEVGPVDLLHYAAPFGRGTDAGWIAYGGDWSVNDGVYTDRACGNADKAVSGGTGWTDYALTADVQLTSAGRAGLLVRVTNPAVGPEAMNGYYVGLSSNDGTVFIGREDGKWTSLGTAPMPGGVFVGVWYHVTVEVIGSGLRVSAIRAGTEGHPVTIEVQDAHFLQGAVGVRADNATAAWRAVEVSAILR